MKTLTGILAVLAIATMGLSSAQAACQKGSACQKGNGCNGCQKSVAQKGDGCCQKCGHHGVRRQCRPVKTTKKIEITVWACECDEVCLGGPCEHGNCGILGGHHGCSKGCTQKGGKCDGGCAKFPAQAPAPGCATSFPRTKLLKKTIVKEVPAIKWVVDYKCDGCGNCSKGKGGVAPAPAGSAPEGGADVPETPQPPAPPEIRATSYQAPAVHVK